jgi:hypothetical protein
MMENKLKKLSTTMDPEISKGKVFTDNDQQQILTRIRDLSSPRKRTKKGLSLIPRFLTAALFLGIVFTSYHFTKEVPVPQTQPNVETNQEKAHVTIEGVKGDDSSAKYLLQNDQKKLIIHLRITNISDSTIKDKLKHKITFLNSALVEASGFRSNIIELAELQELRPQDTAIISKEFNLKKEITKEDLNNAIKVETMSDSEIYSSFVIDKIDYEVEKKKEKIVEEKEEEKNEEPAAKEATDEKVSLAQAKQILINNLAEIKFTLSKSGEKHNWNYDNPATYEIVAPDLKPYVTDRFSKNVLTELIPRYFCECDQGTLPRIHQEVRFTIHSNDGMRMEISAIEPASDMNNVGFQWNFVFVKEETEWKIDQWRESSLEGANLRLTKEEASELLTTERQTATFIKEVQIDDSKAYVFKVIGDGIDTMVAIYASDTTLIQGYEEKKR